MIERFRRRLEGLYYFGEAESDRFASFSLKVTFKKISNLSKSESSQIWTFDAKRQLQSLLSAHQVSFYSSCLGNPSSIFRSLVIPEQAIIKNTDRGLYFLRMVSQMHACSVPSCQCRQLLQLKKLHNQAICHLFVQSIRFFVHQFEFDTFEVWPKF